MDDDSKINGWVDDAFNNPRNLSTRDELLDQARVGLKGFQRCDVDKSGCLTLKELAMLCESLCLPLEKDEDEALMKMDKDGSGEIDEAEFMAFWLRRVSMQPNPLKQQEAIARNTFKKFDTDGGGSLDIKELKVLLDYIGAKFSPDELKMAMRELDADGNGTIEMEEFVTWWTNRSSSSRKGGLIALKLRKLASKASQIFFTDIFTAVWNGDVELVKIFLESDKRMANATDTNDFADGWAPLHYAAYQGFSEIVQVLLDAGAKVNQGNDKGFTPLFYAAQRNHISIVSKLLENGADPAIVGSTSDEDSGVSMFMCPAEHALDSPELFELFRSHPKGTDGPELPLDLLPSLPTLSNTGVLTVFLPQQKHVSTLPLKRWRVNLSYVPGPQHEEDSEQADQPEKSNDDDDGKEDGSGVDTSKKKNVTEKEKLSLPPYIDYIVPSSHPSTCQDLTLQIDKAWLRSVRSQPISLRLTPVNCINIEGPQSLPINVVVVQKTPKPSQTPSVAGEGEGEGKE